EIVARSENLFPDKSTRSRFVQRFLEHTITESELAADIDESQVTVNSVRGNDDAFDKLMGIAFHNNAVLARSGLAFIRVTTEINRLTGILGHEAPLHACWKPRATPAPQASRFRHLDDVFWREFLEYF